LRSVITTEAWKRPARAGHTYRIFTCWSVYAASVRIHIQPVMFRQSKCLRGWKFQEEPYISARLSASLKEYTAICFGSVLRGMKLVLTPRLRLVPIFCLHSHRRRPQRMPIFPIWISRITGATDISPPILPWMGQPIILMAWWAILFCSVRLRPRHCIGKEQSITIGIPLAIGQHHRGEMLFLPYRLAGTPLSLIVFLLLIIARSV